MPGIGETLRAARRQQGRTLADAAAETRVREAYLAALEQEDFAVLGGDVYVKGFLRSYARYLQLDPEPLVETYRNHHERPDDNTHALPPAGYSDPMLPVGDRSRPPRPLVVGLTAAAVVVVLAAVAFNRGDDPPAATAGGPEPVATNPLDDLLDPALTATQPPVAPPAPAAVASGATPLTSLEVEVRVVGIEAQLLVSEGQPPVQAVLSQGDTRVLTGDRVVFQVSDGTAVEVLVNGEVLPLGGIAAPLEISCAVGEAACRVSDA